MQECECFFFIRKEIYFSSTYIYFIFCTLFVHNLLQRPVLVFLHGGAFIFGGTTLMTGEYLMDQDLVFVTVQVYKQQKLN